MADIRAMAAAESERYLAGHPDDVMRIARAGMLAIVVGFGGFVTWAAWAPLAQGLSGHGAVAVAGERKYAQPAMGGVVRTIRVREGQHVQQGDVLVELNTTEQQSELETVRGQWFAARASEARLQTEHLGRQTIDWPEDLRTATDARAAMAMQLQTQLFDARRAEQRDQLRMLEHEAAGLSEQINGYEEIQRRQAEQIQLQTRELNNLRTLEKKGFVARQQVFDAQRNAAQLGAQQASTLADLGRTRQALDENRVKAGQLRQTFLSDVDARLAQASGDVATLAERRRALEFAVGNGIVTAPATGEIMELDVHTVGGVVAAGQKLMSVVPSDSPWIVKTRFATQSIDRLKAGLPVDVKFSTLDTANAPVVQGVVQTVSADQQLDEHTGEPYVTVTARVTPDAIADLEHQGIQVRPGMQVDVMVKTGERTVLNYLLKPILVRLSGAFREE